MKSFFVVTSYTSQDKAEAFLDSDILFFCRYDSDCWISFHLCISAYSHPYNTAFSLPMKRNLLKRLPIISQKTCYSYIVIIYQKPGKKAKPFPRPTKKQNRSHNPPKSELWICSFRHKIRDFHHPGHAVPMMESPLF